MSFIIFTFVTVNSKWRQHHTNTHTHAHNVSKINWIIELQWKLAKKKEKKALHAHWSRRHDAQIQLGDDCNCNCNCQAHFEWLINFHCSVQLEVISQLVHLFGLFGPSCDVNEIEVRLNKATVAREMKKKHRILWPKKTICWMERKKMANRVKKSYVKRSE